MSSLLNPKPEPEDASRAMNRNVKAESQSLSSSEPTASANGEVSACSSGFHCVGHGVEAGSDEPVRSRELDALLQTSDWRHWQHDIPAELSRAEQTAPASRQMPDWEGIIKKFEAIGRQKGCSANRIEEATQEALVGVLGRARNTALAPIRTLEAYLTTSFKNALFRGVGSAQVTSVDDLADVLKAKELTFNDLATSEEYENLITELHRVLNSDPFYEVEVLHHLQGLSTLEISRRLAMPKGTVTWRLKKARERLLLHFRAHGLGPLPI